MKKIILSIVAVSALMFTSCSDDNDTPPTPPNNSTKIEDVLNYEYIKEAGLEVKVSEEAKVDFIKWNADAEKVKGITTKAEAGKAGFLSRMKDGKKYNLNETGVEVKQLISKGSIGGFQLYNYNEVVKGVKEAKTDADRKVAIEKIQKILLGVGTTKETSKDDFNAKGNSFGKYMVGTKNNVKVFDLIEEAKANVADKTKYNEALTKLTAVANKVVGLRAVHYLVLYTDKIIKDTEKKDLAKNIHELSEGLGFAYSLQFAHQGEGKFYLTAKEAKEIVSANLWRKEDLIKLKAKGEEIAKKFGEEFLAEATKE